MASPVPLAAAYDLDVEEVLSKEALEAAHCREADDHVPQQPAMTGFRRRLRYHQSRWREAHGHPIGSQPIAPRPDDGPARPVGSRLPLAYAKEIGANFLTAHSLDAARPERRSSNLTRASITSDCGPTSYRRSR